MHEEYKVKCKTLKRVNCVNNVGCINNKIALFLVDD